MSRDIFNPNYWYDRLKYAQDRGQEYQALYRTNPDDWQAIETCHRGILLNLIQPNERILDAGCGWGRLIDLLPTSWRENHDRLYEDYAGMPRDYLGVDLSPDFICKARQTYPTYKFMCADLRELRMPDKDNRFDWCICIAVREMVIGHAGSDVWLQIDGNLRAMCRKLLLLTYDKNDSPRIILGS